MASSYVISPYPYKQCGFGQNKNLANKQVQINFTFA